MPAFSEEVYKPESAEKDSWLAKKMSALSDAGQWKVTKFETTPPVGFLYGFRDGLLATYYILS